MSTTFMLDTDAVSALVRGRAPALDALLAARPVCISVVTEAEMRYGLAQGPVSPALRSIVEGFLAASDTRVWTPSAAQRYGQLRAHLDTQGRPLAPLDLLIAAQALAESCVLVTADRAFSQVPGLEILDWTTEA